MIKKCQMCKKEKLIDKFSPSNVSRSNGRCRPCVKKFNKKYQIKNKEKIKKQRKEHYDQNREELLLNHKIYYKNNNDALLAQKKTYYHKNKKSLLLKNKEWCENNKDYLIDYKKKYYKKRIKADPQYRLRKSFSAIIFHGLKRNYSSKYNQSFQKYILYSIDDLKKHLENNFESWMTWDNWGVYKKATWKDDDQSTWKWQIDHIIPHSTFQYTSMEDDAFKQCWSLSNLSPYSAKQNILDGATKIRNREEI